MKPTRTEPAEPGGTVDAWRRRRLIVAGFDPQLAGRLAGDDAVDLHALLTLRDRGCPPELAARILAPIDRPVA
jgi:hypothetical protein